MDAEVKPQAFYPSKLLLQWHLTERCNLRCAHCYQESYQGRELAPADWEAVLAQFVDLLHSAPTRIPGHITVTGGEPFILTDFFALLERFAAHRRDFSFAVLTNGTLIDAAAARQLKALGVGFVQVSVEGTESTHERIRGAGSYRRAVTAIEQLVKAGVRTMISFTAHRDNYREFPAVAELGYRLKAARVWADRLIPQGQGAALSELLMSPDETHEFIRIMAEARKAAQRRWFNHTEIAMHRALQFLEGGGLPYRCTAGESLLTLQANGDLLPCRRMPIVVGNVLQMPLAELYQSSPLLRALRDRERISVGCEACAFARLCRGGLRCLAYAVTGDPFHADPGCWLKKET